MAIVIGILFSKREWIISLLLTYQLTWIFVFSEFYELRTDVSPPPLFYQMQSLGVLVNVHWTRKQWLNISMAFFRKGKKCFSPISPLQSDSHQKTQRSRLRKTHNHNLQAAITFAPLASLAVKMVIHLFLHSYLFPPTIPLPNFN